MISQCPTAGIVGSGLRFVSCWDKLKIFRLCVFENLLDHQSLLISFPVTMSLWEVILWHSPPIMPTTGRTQALESETRIQALALLAALLCRGLNFCGLRFLTV